MASFLIFGRYQQAKDNKTANRWAQEVGEESAESLKEGIVGNQGAKFNMFKNKDTGEIVLIGIKKAIEIATGLFLKK